MMRAGVERIGLLPVFIKFYCNIGTTFIYVFFMAASVLQQQNCIVIPNTSVADEA